MDSLVNSLGLVNASGALIIAVILLLLCFGIAANIVARLRYAALSRELTRDRPLEAVVLLRAVGEVQTALERLPAGADARGIDTPSIVERAVQKELGPLLLAERFVKANAGLLITLGLVGTFYGLTHSIGQLVTVVSNDVAPEADVAESLTSGLTDALGGMSVAFTTSLVGIIAAIVMTLLSVFANIAERRTRFVTQLEAHLDQLVAERVGPGEAAARATEQFSQAVGVLVGSIQRFEEALERFAGNTRDFHEFNLHLKDNIQRMSVSFADLTSALSDSAGTRTAGAPGRLPPGGQQ